MIIRRSSYLMLVNLLLHVKLGYVIYQTAPLVYAQANIATRKYIEFITSLGTTGSSPMKYFVNLNININPTLYK